MWRVAAVIALVLAAACADEPSRLAESASDAPTQAELTCATDGTVTLSTATVQPQTDGVHLRVVNEFDEPVSVGGFDSDPGTTDWVFSWGPGTTELMCWPFSEHGSSDPPSRHALEIVDPAGLYFDGSLECEISAGATGTTAGATAEEPIDAGPPPLSVAGELITGLQADDVLRVIGYPASNGTGIAVIRGDEVVASYQIVRFSGQGWTLSAGTACPETGLPFEGEHVS
jgi:hypothetical protein